MLQRYFDELQTDALTELINIGVSGSATRFSQMVRATVRLTVPAIGVVSAKQATEMMSAWWPGQLVAIEESFAGALSGRALLVFPADHRETLFRALTSDSEERHSEDLLRDALQETGNVLLQGCLSAIANLLERPLSIGSPEMRSGPAPELLNGPSTAVVVFVYVTFHVDGREIRGYLAIVLDLPSVEALRALVSAYIARVT